MFKRLVDDREVYTPKGNHLADLAKLLLEPVIDTMIDEGYSAIDMQYILMEEISLLILEKKMIRDLNLRGGK